ncbi:alpha/beta hydrolase [Jiella sp. MQZ9-1]|uniref:Alpha/beta hydrolase n=1 Tax=Jiella flava TaxID=2816857 RepID=A0A939FTP8_9HYPH|nr:alpha/beta hydrolase [Jiella flava]MBO0661377.1 alpha/beta hydrolase [Jiella flava]MCD2470022.1 alpha/beta hydrolase [Jiella flava]
MTDSADDPRFVEIPGNPPPPGLTGGYFSTSDGRRLRYAISKGERPTRGTIVLLQGRNEAIEKYFETIADLNRRGFAVATFDWRGQGGSERLLRRRNLGHVRHFGQYLTDLECAMQEVVLPDCRAPYTILAHSMGGLIALHASSRLPISVERMVLLAPLIGFARSVPNLKTLDRVGALGRLLGLGTLPVRRSVPDRLLHPATNPLTCDRRRFDRNRRLAKTAPELFLGSPTLAWLAAMAKAMRRLENSDEIAALSIPTLIVTAGADSVVSAAAAERLAWRMRCGSSLTIPLARHEMLQESDRFREQVLEAFDAYVGEDTPLAAA